jgi:hypothetical protein
VLFTSIKRVLTAAALSAAVSLPALPAHAQDAWPWYKAESWRPRCIGQDMNPSQTLVSMQFAGLPLGVNIGMKVYTGKGHQPWPREALPALIIVYEQLDHGKVFHSYLFQSKVDCENWLAEGRVIP